MTVTMDGAQGAEAAHRLGTGPGDPRAFRDYGVFASPLSDFTKAMSERGLGDRIVEIERGQTVTHDRVGVAPRCGGFVLRQRIEERS